ncbi:MAG: hypothetical protein VKJ24_20030 [Synechococcales bacterium]|nr:hypothetical protein [Synechococcales bacterium]
MSSQTVNSQSQQSLHANPREDFSEYVAHLQLHMVLQARNLVPSMNHTEKGRNDLLQQTQATIEKQISRQF